MQQPSRILVRAPNWIGDQVMAIPFYEGLRELYPQAHLCLLRPETLEGVLPQPLFNEEWSFRREQLKTWRSQTDWVKKIRAGKFDLAFCLPGSWSAAWLFWRAGINHRIGFSQGGNGCLQTYSRPWRGVDAGKHKSELYPELLESIGYQGRGVKPLQSLSRLMSSENYLVVAPGASLPLREWPGFLELFHALRRLYPQWEIRVVGASGDSAWHARLERAQMEGVIDCIEKTTLPELIKLCERAQLVIANDSGTAHLSATLARVPTVVLFGPGNPDYIVPRGPRVVGARNETIPCSPCERAYCRAPFGYQLCLKALSLETVLEAVKKAVSL